MGNELKTLSSTIERIQNDDKVIKDAISVIHDDIENDQELHKQLKKIATKEISKVSNNSCDEIHGIVQQLELIASTTCHVIVTNCEHGINCQSIKYLIDTLSIYKRHIQSVQSHQESLNQKQKTGNAFRVVLLNQYQHLLFYHQNEFEYIYNVLNKNIYSPNGCNALNCLLMRRNRRNRSSTTTISELKALYGEDDIVEQQLLDTIHCYFMHSFDTGYRLPNTEKKTDVEIITPQQTLNNDITYDKNHKFMMKQYNDEHQYYYWAYFKSMHTTLDPSVLINIPPHIKQNSDERISLWFINPRYKDFKNELLHNEICAISVNQYHNIQAIAESLVQSYTGREMYCFRAQYAHVYDLQHKESIQIRHLMAIKIYTTFHMLRRQFRQTYRKLSNSETNEQLKRRHRYFYFLGKYLTELVECFGMSCQDMLVYHGIQTQCIRALTSVYPYIKGPFSVSTSKQVVNVNTGDAMILELKINGNAWRMEWGISRMKCFDCGWISDFANEQEIFFLSRSNKHTIQNIYYGQISYECYVKAMGQITFCLRGNNVRLDMLQPSEKLSKADQKWVAALMSNELYQYHSELECVKKLANEFKVCPNYIQQLLHTYCGNVKSIFFGEKQNFVFRTFFQLQNKWAHLERLTAVFPKLDTLAFRFDNIDAITKSLEYTVKFIEEHSLPLRLIVVQIDGEYNQKILEAVNANEQALDNIGWKLRARVIDEELIADCAVDMGMDIGMKLFKDFKGDHAQLGNGIMVEIRRVTETTWNSSKQSIDKSAKKSENTNKMHKVVEENSLFFYNSNNTQPIISPIVSPNIENRQNMMPFNNTQRNEYAQEIIKENDTDLDTICWEFNTFKGCKKGIKHPLTGKILDGNAVREFRLNIGTNIVTPKTKEFNMLSNNNGEQKIISRYDKNIKPINELNQKEEKEKEKAKNKTEKKEEKEVTNNGNNDISNNNNNNVQQPITSPIVSPNIENTQNIIQFDNTQINEYAQDMITDNDNDLNTICWEFNTFKGCKKGTKCKWKHEYIIHSLEPSNPNTKTNDDLYDDTFVTETMNNENTIENAIATIEKLMQLAISLKQNNVFYNYSLDSTNLIFEYGTGDESNQSSSNPSNDSGDSKRNSDQNENNFNNNRKNDFNANNNDSSGNDDDKSDEKASGVDRCHCNVPEHASLQEENKKLRLLLQKQAETIQAMLDQHSSTEVDADILNVNSDEKTKGKNVYVCQLKKIKTNKRGKTTSINSPRIKSKNESHNVNGDDCKHTLKDVILSRKLTNEVIPRYETFSNVIVYMNQYLYIHKNNAVQQYECKEDVIRVIDYNIHCKQTQQKFYVVCDKVYDSNKEHHIWKTRNNLYTKGELEKLHNNGNNTPPTALSLTETKISQIEQSKEQIMKMLQNTKQRNSLIGSRHTPWNREDKIPIFNKSSNYNGLCLIWSKQEFVNKLKSFADKNISNNIVLVPIIRFDKYEYFYEICWIVEIGKKINIAISFRKKPPKMKSNLPYIPSAIYLDIHDQHKLVLYKHDCKCLQNFICDIDRLQIGESKQIRKYQRRINREKVEYANLQKQMNEFMEQREQNILIVNEMIETSKNLKSDLESLQQKQIDVQQQQNYCQQLLTLNGITFNQPLILPFNNPLRMQNLQPQIQQYNNKLNSQIINLNQNQ